MPARRGRGRPGHLRRRRAAGRHRRAAGRPGSPGAVIELNASPGLRMHLSPAEGPPRDVAAAVIDRLYPPGAPVRHPGHLGDRDQRQDHHRPDDRARAGPGRPARSGMATTDGVYRGGRPVYAADASGPRSAQMVLDDPSVEAAVLETARGGIIRGGLGYDQADVAVVTNITADHLGRRRRRRPGRADPRQGPGGRGDPAGGTVVLNADDPAAAGLAERPAVRGKDPDIRFFTLRPDSPVALAAPAGRRAVLRGPRRRARRDSGRGAAAGARRWPSCPARSAGGPRTWWPTRSPRWPPAARPGSASRTSGGRWPRSRRARPTPAGATCTGRAGARSSSTTATTPPPCTPPAR